MAEGLLKKMLADKERQDISVYSTGVSTIDGFAPTDNTVKVMKEEGIDVSNYKTAKLTKDRIENADLILAMEKIHKEKVVELVPEAKKKTYLLKEYVHKKDKISGISVPDPIGKPLEVYETSLKMIKESLEEVVKRL